MLRRIAQLLQATTGVAIASPQDYPSEQCLRERPESLNPKKTQPYVAQLTVILLHGHNTICARKVANSKFAITFI